VKIAGVDADTIAAYDAAALEDLRTNLAARREGQASLV
jgi:hypothetical protein